MSGPSRNNLAGAGLAMVATMVLCGARFGVGALVGLAAPPGLAGLFAGLAVGFALVHERFRDI